MTPPPGRMQAVVRFRESCFVRAAPSAAGAALGVMKRGEGLPCRGDASPDGWLSLRTDVPQVDVIHDLNFEYRKDFLQSKFQNYYVKYFPHFARKAARLATVSEFSKRDLHNFYGIDEDKIDLIFFKYNYFIVK